MKDILDIYVAEYNEKVGSKHTRPMKDFKNYEYPDNGYVVVGIGTHEFCTKLLKQYK